MSLGVAFQVTQGTPPVTFYTVATAQEVITTTTDHAHALDLAFEFSANNPGIPVSLTEQSFKGITIVRPQL